VIYSAVPKANIEKFHILSLPLNGFTFELTTSMGVVFKILDKTNDTELLSVERLFENGSIRVQYIQLTKQRPLDRKMLQPLSTPQYNIIPDEGFQHIIELLGDEEYEVEEDVETYAEYCLRRATMIQSEKLTDELKTQIANKVRELEYPVTL
jgi:hypothetical protein